ncbi:MAG: hypothetical protein WC450_12435, partial [Candidatus Omnitrophota bacterium]
MKRLILCVIFLIFAQIIVVISADASSIFTFYPNPSNFNDLDHYRYYLWGMNWTIPTNEHITGASFFINDINNWTVEANDHLFIGLLDESPLGVNNYY